MVFKGDSRKGFSLAQVLVAIGLTAGVLVGGIYAGMRLRESMIFQKEVKKMDEKHRLFSKMIAEDLDSAILLKSSIAAKEAAFAGITYDFDSRTLTIVKEHNSHIESPVNIRLYDPAQPSNLRPNPANPEVRVLLTVPAPTCVDLSVARCQEEHQIYQYFVSSFQIQTQFIIRNSQARGVFVQDLSFPNSFTQSQTGLQLIGHRYTTRLAPAVEDFLTGRTTLVSAETVTYQLQNGIMYRAVTDRASVQVGPSPGYLVTRTVAAAQRVPLVWPVQNFDLEFSFARRTPDDPEVNVTERFRGLPTICTEETPRVCLNWTNLHQVHMNLTYQTERKDLRGSLTTADSETTYRRDEEGYILRDIQFHHTPETHRYSLSDGNSGGNDSQCPSHAATIQASWCRPECAHLFDDPDRNSPTWAAYGDPQSPICQCACRNGDCNFDFSGPAWANPFWGNMPDWSPSGGNNQRITTCMEALGCGRVDWSIYAKDPRYHLVCNDGCIQPESNYITQDSTRYGAYVVNQPALEAAIDSATDPAENPIFRCQWAVSCSLVAQRMRPSFEVRGEDDPWWNRCRCQNVDTFGDGALRYIGNDRWWWELHFDVNALCNFDSAPTDDDYCSTTMTDTGAYVAFDANNPRNKQGLYPHQLAMCACLQDSRAQNPADPMISRYFNTNVATYPEYYYRRNNYFGASSIPSGDRLNLIQQWNSRGYLPAVATDSASRSLASQMATVEVPVLEASGTVNNRSYFCGHGGAQTADNQRGLICCFSNAAACKAGFTDAQIFQVPPNFDEYQSYCNPACEVLDGPPGQWAAPNLGFPQVHPAIDRSAARLEIERIRRIITGTPDGQPLPITCTTRADGGSSAPPPDGNGNPVTWGGQQ